MNMSDSKERMVAKAAELFQKQGYSGTGLKQIIEESGTPRGSLYFHFPGGKEELAVEALQYACAARLETMHAIFDQTSSTLDGVEMLVGVIQDRLVDSGFQEGSPIATVVLETAATSDVLQRTCSKTWRQWTALFEERLIEEGHDPEQAAGKALVVLTMLEGGLLLSRAYRSTEPLDVVGDEMRRVLQK